MSFATGSYVVEEELASCVAQSLGVRTLKSEKFLEKIMPSYLGLDKN